jgi:plastocyanin
MKIERCIWPAVLACVLLPVAASAQVAAAPKPDTTVTIRSSGTALEFEPDEIMLKQGLRVRIRFVNESSFPHNLIFVRDQMEIGELAAIAMNADKTGNVPLTEAKKMFAWTSLAQPNTTVEVTFVVPPPGMYTFVCLSPGHHNTMLGSLRSLK